MRGKRLVLLGLCLLFLAGCRQTAFRYESLKSGGLFLYPETQWNMTPEEVQAALGLTGEQLTLVSENIEDDILDQVFLAEEPAASGMSANLYFWFRAYGSAASSGLRGVTWIFDETADLEAVQRELEAAFGKADSVHAVYPVSCWDGEDPLTLFMSEEILEKRKAALSGTAGGEAVLAQMEAEPASSLILVNDPEIALPMATLPAVPAHAKMLIISSSVSDVLQINASMAASPAAGSD